MPGVQVIDVETIRRYVLAGLAGWQIAERTGYSRAAVYKVMRYLKEKQAS